MRSIVGVSQTSVHVIRKSAWRDAVASNPTLGPSIGAWHKVACEAKWESIVDVRKTYPHADFVEPYTIFNIKGNAYRLIVKIEYKWQMIFVKHLLTHEDYARGGWR